MNEPQGMPRVDEIPWALPPLPRLELLPAADLLALGPGELLEYAYDLQRELLALRDVLHASLSATARVTRHLDRALEVIRQRNARNPRPPS